MKIKIIGVNDPLILKEIAVINQGFFGDGWEFVDKDYPSQTSLWNHINQLEVLELSFKKTFYQLSNRLKIRADFKQRKYGTFSFESVIEWNGEDEKLKRHLYLNVYHRMLESVATQIPP